MKYYRHYLSSYLMDSQSKSNLMDCKSDIATRDIHRQGYTSVLKKSR